MNKFHDHSCSLVINSVSSRLSRIPHKDAFITFLLHFVKIFPISDNVAYGAKNVKELNRRFSFIDDVIRCFLMTSSNHSNLSLKSSLDKPEKINENFRFEEFDDWPSLQKIPELVDSESAGLEESIHAESAIASLMFFGSAILTRVIFRPSVFKNLWLIEVGTFELPMLCEEDSTTSYVRAQKGLPRRIKKVVKLRASFEQPQPEYVSVFRQRRSVQPSDIVVLMKLILEEILYRDQIHDYR
nr:hypothetical protein [Tanacetum cinerariifolium]